MPLYMLSIDPLRIPVRRRFSSFFFFLVMGIFFLTMTGCARSITNHGLPTVMEMPPVPDSAESLKNLPEKTLEERGFSYLASGNLGLAELHFLAALKKGPHTPEVYAGLGETFRQQRKWSQAESAYEQALAMDPGNVRALLGTGKMYREQGQVNRALPFLLKARKAAPRNPEVLTEVAITCDATGDGSTAESLFQQVVAIKPESAAAHNNLGFHYLLTGHYAKAVTAFRRAAALAPENKVIQCNLATAAALDGNEKVAISLFTQNLGAAAAYNNIGYLFMVRGNDQKAAAALQRALDLDPRFYARAKSNLDRLQGTSAAPLP